MHAIEQIIKSGKRKENLQFKYIFTNKIVCKKILFIYYDKKIIKSLGAIYFRYQ